MGNVWYIVILCLGILYVLSPIDLVPDFVPILGWVEDLLVFSAALWWANRMRTAAPADAASGQGDASKRSQADSDPMRDQRTELLPKTPWQLLGIEPDASKAAVEAAYKVQLMQYHPDRVAHLGKDLQRLAHERTLEIQRAYEQIKRRRT